MSYEPEKNKEYLRLRYLQSRREIFALIGERCAICGSEDSLEVDHIDWRQKSMEMPGVITKGNRESVHEELKKCQALCKRHHSEKTIRDRSEMRHKNVTHGKMYAWMKMKCQCEECNQARSKWNSDRNAKRRLSSGKDRGSYTTRRAVQEGRAEMPEHGDSRRYKTWGCRCEKCLAANSLRKRSSSTKN